VFLLRRKLLFLATALFVLPGVIRAADRPSGRPEARGDGFEQLFNGKDLRGWKGDTNLWFVQSSNLVGRTTAARPLLENTFLIWTNGTVHDFELQWQYRITANDPQGLANSGIQYRSRELTNNPTAFVVAGYLADIETGDQHTGGLYEERGRGRLAERGQMTRVGSSGTVHPIASLGSTAELQTVIRKEDWNDYTIIARGNQLTHIINGRVMVHVTDMQEGARSFNGILALQLHAGQPMTVEFKNLRLKPL